MSMSFSDDSDSDTSTKTISNYETPASRVEPYTPSHTMEGFIKSTSGAAANGGSTSTPSTPICNQENIGPNSPTPRTITKAELLERDRNAIAYSKSLLQEGDTLVFIDYPANTQVFDHTGFLLISQNPFRVHSDKLLCTGSTKFQKLLSEWEQAKVKRRRRLFSNLPAGVQYVLDLTPPDEGDEAVELIKHRCKVSADVCAGKDEIARPIKPKPTYKNYTDLADALTDDFEPEPNLVNDVRNFQLDKGEGIDVDVDANSSASRAPLVGATAKVLEEQQIQDAIRQSKLDAFGARPTTPPKAKGYDKVEQIPEYCPIRHRAGIERLLQLIEGKQPRLDSAVKVWTLFVLAKYFDCTKVVADSIATWALGEPNCQFIEILPEATLRMGLGLKSPILTRPSFAILVSEHALSTISRECGAMEADKAGTNQFSRLREDIDEDTLNAIQAAAYSLIGRVQDVLTDLCDSQMAWLAKLPEYQKIDRIMTWANESSISYDEKCLIKDSAETLKQALAHFVRGRLLWGFNAEINQDANDQANDHRKAETYAKEYTSDFANDIYSAMAEKEKMITTFAWKSLKTLAWGTHCQTNLILDEEGIEAWLIKKLHGIARHHGVERVKMFDLMRVQSQLNAEILKSIQIYGFNFGRVPDESFQCGNIFQYQEDSDPETGHDDGWGFPPTTYPPGNTPKTSYQPPQDNFALPSKQYFHNADETPVEKHEPLHYAARSQSGRDSQEYLRGKEGDMPERLDPDNESMSSTQPLLNYPLRPKLPKDTDIMSLTEKQPRPNDTYTSGVERPSPGSSMINRISNIISASTAFLGTSHQLADPREQATAMHNTVPPTAGPPPTKPLLIIPNIPVPKKSTPPHPKTYNLPSARPAPRVPHDHLINTNSPFFSLANLFYEVQARVRRVTSSILTTTDELDFTVLTDTLLCLTDDEWKYLPLWAGGNEDGSGGVFAPAVPPAPPGAGPNGPGPAFHTGYSMPSRSGTEMDFDDTSTIGDSIDTSIAVENGYSDHLDRRQVVSEDDFRSEAFSDDTEDYVSNIGKGNYTKYADLLDGEVSDDSEVYVGKGKGKAGAHDGAQVSADTEGTDDSADDEGDDEWDGGDDEEAFDYGDETMADEDGNDTVTG